MAYVNPQAKLYQHLDRLVELKEGLHPPPINVELDLSNRCGLACVWCPFDHLHTGGQRRPDPYVGDLMEEELALRIVRELAEVGVRSVTWTGGGEPTMHPSFKRIVEECRLPQGIYTNGTRLGSGLASVIKQRMDWAVISLDCPDAESYKQLKGVDLFNEACAGAKHLARFPGQAVVGLSILLGPDNWRKWRLAVPLARNLGVDYVQFKPMVIPDIDQGWALLCYHDLAPIEGQPGVELDRNRFLMVAGWQGHGYKTCWWSALQASVTPDGRLWACVNKRGMVEVGDLSQRSFRDAWADIPIQQVDEQCRMHCRGHLPNLTLDQIMATGGDHAAFV